MKEKTFCSFSEVEEKKVSALQTLGLARVEARLVVYLAIDHDKIDFRTIELEANLRQPEVSIGMKRLRNRGDLEGFKLRGTLNDITKRLYDKRIVPLNKAMAMMGDEKQ